MSLMGMEIRNWNVHVVGCSFVIRSNTQGIKAISLLLGTNQKGELENNIIIRINQTGILHGMNKIKEPIGQVSTKYLVKPVYSVANNVLRPMDKSNPETGT